MVKVFTYDWDGLDRFGHPAEDAHIPLEMAFEEFNVGTGDLAQRYRDRRLRSLSVGDVVTAGETAWASPALAGPRLPGMPPDLGGG